jgi:DNA polymerase I-like protein with 3'-5' exonuclease and polymerase domains
MLETGRTSSYANKLIPNSIAMQNLPRKEGMRECFRPRAGCLFGAVDYAMAELVALAQICYTRFGYSKLREALNAGQDPHVLLGAKILGLDYTEAMARYIAGDPILKKARQDAKPVSFGFPGGLGIEAFIEYARVTYGAIFDEDKARAYKEAWLTLYPEMRDYFRWFSGLCDQTGFCDIQQFMSKRVRGHIPYTVACNTMFQGLTADGAKAALYESIRRCYIPVYVDEKMNAISLRVGQRPPSWAQLSKLYGSRIVNFVHDEEVAEMKEEKGHEVVFELAHVMRSEYQPFTPDVIIRTEECLMRRWRKGAKPVTHNGKSVHEGGILVPYEDAELWKGKAA